MGQQQLLLLVLATVIVGLATVAGIQAFDENRNQAAADALSQKASSLAADMKAIAAKPQQIGGIDPDDAGTSDMTQRLGITDSVSVPTANGGCEVSTVTAGGSGSFKASVKCQGNGDYSELSFFGIYDQTSEPEVYVQNSDI
jgi:hypothetical protein